ncbi:unnamed protein product, partial [Discosporangium mesarthrocarpum]
VVGGLAEVKQERQLACHPEVVVATPGRLWELSLTHEHLRRLASLRHLVIDEADRMLERGHFPELERLFTLLGVRKMKKGAKGGTRGAEGSGSGRGRGRGRGRSKGGRGIQRMGGGRPEWAQDVWGEGEGNGEGEGSEEEGNSLGEAAGTDRVSKAWGGGNEEEEEGEEGLDWAGGAAADDSEEEKLRRNRQTYVFSATLTLGASSRQVKGKGRKKGPGAGVGAHDEDPVQEIMAQVGLRGQPVVVDI